jgi:hypothetical protein
MMPKRLPALNSAASSSRLLLLQGSANQTTRCSPGIRTLVLLTVPMIPPFSLCGVCHIKSWQNRGALLISWQQPSVKLWRPWQSYRPPLGLLSLHNSPSLVKIPSDGTSLPGVLALAHGNILAVCRLLAPVSVSEATATSNVGQVESTSTQHSFPLQGSDKPSDDTTKSANPSPVLASTPVIK